MIMGQHKTNPVALAAARGELPPRPPKISKREMDRRLYAEVNRLMWERLINASAKCEAQDVPVTCSK